MASAAVGTVEAITGDLDLFSPPSQQNSLKNAFDRRFSPIASIQPGAPIEFMVKGADQLYLDMDRTLMTVNCKITKADGTNIPDNSAGLVNLAFHSMWSEMSVELSGRQASETNQLYPYRSYIETLLNYSTEVQKTRLLTEGWVMDTAGKMDVTKVDGENLGLKERAKWTAGSQIVQFVGRPHLDVFQQGRCLLPGVDVHLKCIPNSNKFVIKSKAPDVNGVQEDYKLKIEDIHLTMFTKELISDAALAHTAILEAGTMAMYPYQRCEMKQFSIPQNHSSYNIENVFIHNLPDLVVVGLVADEDFAGNYNKNPFNFQTFGVSRMELKRNGMPVPRYGYTPNFGTKLFNEAYITFQRELGYDVGNQCVQLTPTEWANGYTLFVYKITDGPIGSGIEGPRSKAPNGSTRLEVTLSAPAPKAIKVIVYSAGLGVLKIDNYKNTIVE